MQQMNQLMQMFNMMKNANNPMALMQQMSANNPQMQMALKMANGKNPQEIQQVIQNVCQQKGISQEQLQQMASQFGLKL